MKVLVLNSGSSSLKFAVVDTNIQCNLLSGVVERLNTGHGCIQASYNQLPYKKDLDQPNHKTALKEVLEYLELNNITENFFDAIGHRVVHGGEKFTQAQLICSRVLKEIESCIPLAPLHNQANLEGIYAAQSFFPNKPQVAIFDTSFHQTIPQRAYRYSLPKELYTDHGVRKYGFHGSSHRYVASIAAMKLHKPVEKCCIITAHLGNGCSATAIKYGKSIDTTMGLTPLEGLVMGTRCGSIDPGLHEYLHDKLGWNLSQINHVLNKKSGLLGISQLSSDMREVTNAAKEGHDDSKLATEIFSYHLAQAIASLSVNFHDLDALVFTGGIGEHSTTIRAITMSMLRILGFELDVIRNDNDGKYSNGIITTDSTTPRAFVIPTNEELQIAWDVETTLKSS
ncbi:MAG: acetate kinase [Candidatus Cloacimonetes bacterium]|nr:acetate kinase [Candidatus Cloacimonadota bacterium]